jgi:hypothetical protein
MTNDELKQQLELKKQELAVQFQRQSDVYQSNIAAIDSAILVIDGKANPQIENIESGKLRDSILAAIKVAPNEFSLRDIARIIALRNPGTYVSQQNIAGSFWKIVNEEMKLSIAKQGTGNQPTIYKKA